VSTEPAPRESEKGEFYPWHYVNFSVSGQDLAAIARLLDAFPAPWFVCGGWAIDLFAGRQTRPHSDLEIGIFREDQRAIRDVFGGWNLGKVVETPEGPAIVPWYEGECLVLPIHQVKLYNDAVTPREFEFFLNDADKDLWHFRRMPQITMPRHRLIRSTDDHVFYVTPEVQLLYKARHLRDRDRADFETALPLLEKEQRTWLRSALGQFLPEHDWISRLH
jgi:hypothetical protein